MADLDELEYRLEIGARRTRVIVYEEHKKFECPYVAEEDAEDISEQAAESPEKNKALERIFGNLEEVQSQNMTEAPAASKPSRYEQFNYIKRMKVRRETIRELVYNNFDTPYVSMITLTFDSERFENLDFTDLNVAHKEFKKFIQRMNFNFDNFKYVATFSRQQNNNWHYHMICNIGNLTTKEQIEKIWNRGLVWVVYIFKESKLREEVNYCIDNMGQVAASDLKHEKGYLASKGLRRNLILCSWKPEEAKAAEELFNRIKEKPHTMLYSTSHLKGSKVRLTDDEDGIGNVRYNDGLSGLEAGEEKWMAKTHYISSSERLKELFPLLPEARLKKKNSLSPPTT